MQFEIFSGDDLRIIATVRDQAGNLIDITNASIRWALSADSRSPKLLEKTTALTGSAAITKMNASEFFFDLVPADTQSLDGVYYHEVDITTSGGKTYTVLHGPAIIKPNLL